MTRKDYEAIASAMRKVRKDWNFYHGMPRDMKDLLEELDDALADVFARDNDRFDRSRFLSACIPNEED